jgi:hypothetical protein
MSLFSFPTTKFLATIVVLLSSVGRADAYLREIPEIVSVASDPKNPDVVYLRIKGLPCKAAVSTNAGQSFQPVPEESIPPNRTTNLHFGPRHYALANPRYLLRSDDGGSTWTHTGATEFLRDQANADMEQEKHRFWEEYGPRLPGQSALWLPLFGVFAGAHFLLIVLSVHRQGWLRAVWLGLKGLVVILLVWILLWCFHRYVFGLTHSQWPDAYWNTSMLSQPSPKLGVAMAITARPLPLLAYLLVLWPILPGSLDAMLALGGSRAAARRRTCFALSISAGTVFAAFHLWMMFVGSFLE